MKKKLLALILTFTVLATLLAGCSTGTATSASEQVSASQAASDAQARTITDMAGRTIELPATVSKVFPVLPVAAVYLYTFSPDTLLGWNYELSEEESMFMAEEHAGLPVFGMNDSLNLEAVIEAAPQLALMVSNINESAIESADEMSAQLGIPVAIVSAEITDTAEVYRFLGQALGMEERGEEIATYVDEVFADITAAEITEEELVSVYYGNGLSSLETAPQGSLHAQVLELAGVVNVAVSEIEDASRVDVTLEQVLLWNPDIIIANGSGGELSGHDAAEEILNSADWATISAVQNGQVYAVPKVPFSWVDQPRGPNRILGLRWLANLAYPEVYSYDMAEEAKTFYSLFYHIELTDEQLDMVVAG